MKPAIQFADRERHIFALPADSAAIELERPTLSIWVVLAGLSLILGLAWRATASVPSISSALDGVNLALWLSAPWLALAWDRLLRRQQRHIRPLRDPWAWRMANSSYLLFAALLLSVAPVALLLGIDFKEPVALIYLQGGEINLQTGIWFLTSLLLIGPICVVASTVLLHLARLVAGWRWGLAGWLFLVTALNAPLVLGGGPFYVAGSESVRLPLTIGQFATWAAMRVAATQAETPYLHELIGQLILLPATLLLAGLILATVCQQPVRQPALRVDAVWLVTVAAIIAAAARAAWQAWLWSGDLARTAPGDWLVLIYTGIAAAWLVWCLLLLLRIDFDRMTAWRVIGWLLFAVLGWCSLTIAHRFAGQLETQTLLLSAAVTVLVLLAGLLLLYRLAGLSGFRWRWARDVLLILTLACLVVPLPLAGVQVPLVYLAYSQLIDKFSAASTEYSYYVLPTLLLLCFLLWPYGRRRRGPEASAAESASPGE